MKKIGLISDTHGYIDDHILTHLFDCNEVWHAGDWGESVNEIMEKKFDAIKGVYGNIDNHILRRIYPEEQVFEIEGSKVFMTHIGGYPGRYPARIKEKLLQYKPDIFICGHSHILKIIFDKKLNLLHLNPGAAGRSGFHQVRTMLKFDLYNANISNMHIIELGKR